MESMTSLRLGLPTRCTATADAAPDREHDDRAEDRTDETARSDHDAVSSAQAEKETTNERADDAGDEGLSSVRRVPAKCELGHPSGRQADHEDSQDQHGRRLTPRRPSLVIHRAPAHPLGRVAVRGADGRRRAGVVGGAGGAEVRRERPQLRGARCWGTLTVLREWDRICKPFGWPSTFAAHG
jgi:hypothetical protein